MLRLPTIFDDTSDVDNQALADYTSRLPIDYPQQLIGQNAANAVNNVFAPVGDVPRFQTWPEQLVRSGATLPGDVYSGRLPMSLGMRREDYTDIPDERGPSSAWLGSKFGLREGSDLGPNPDLIARTQDLSGMAGGGFAAKPNAVTAMAESSRVGAPIAAMEKAPIFYSAVEKAVKDAKMTKGDADQWLGYIRNQPGVKQEELDWVLHELPKGQIMKGELEQFVNDHKIELKELQLGENQPPTNLHDVAWFRPVVEKIETTKDVQDARRFNANFKETFKDKTDEQLLHDINEYKKLPYTEFHDKSKYSQWQLPGGEPGSYKEMLLTLPDRRMEGPKTFKEWVHESGREDGPDARHDYQAWMASNPDVWTNKNNFTSSHWNEPNVLAHIRTNDRNIPGVGNSLHIEEIQSDWHQKGRQQGYIGEVEKLKPDFDKIEQKILDSNDESVMANPELKDALKSAVDKKIITQDEAKLYERYSNIESGSPVPNAPFKSNWADLSLKRVIRKAAEEGKDSISWTPGEAQAARYDLSKQVDGIRAERNKDGSFTLAAKRKGDSDYLTLIGERIQSNKLADHVGKDLAEKIQDQVVDTKHYDGLDLKLGGEGMKAFYDKMLVDKANAIAKKFGGKVESNVAIQSNPKGWHITPPDQTVSGKWMVKSNDYNSKGFHFDTEVEAKANLEQNIAGERAGNHNIHVLRITPQLRDAALNKGFSLFADTGKVGAPLAALTKVDHNPFTATAFHGSPKEFKGDTINTPEFFSTPNPELAGGKASPLSGGYARSNRPASEATGNSVMPLKLDVRDYGNYDAGGKPWQEINNRAIWEAQQAGKKGVVIKNVIDSPDPNGKPQIINITFDASTVRSKFAKFDPAKFHESGLLKASGLPIITDKDGHQLDHNLKPLNVDEQNALLNRNPLPTHHSEEKPAVNVNKTALALAAIKAGEYAAWAARPSLGGPLWASSIVGNAMLNAAPLKQRREGQPLGRYKLIPIKHDPFKDDEK